MKLEQVLAVKRSALKDLIPSTGKGFVAISRFTSVDEFFKPQDVIIGSRAWLEDDENYLQIIPYAIVKDKDGNILSYSRAAKGSEERLHGKISCGFGGHVNVSDIVVEREEKDTISLDKTIYEACWRELKEELVFKGDAFIPVIDYTETKGLIIDFSNSVGRVHLGILIEATVDQKIYQHSGEVESDDEGIVVEGFSSHHDIFGTGREIEEWTRIALDAYQCDYHSFIVGTTR